MDFETDETTEYMFDDAPTTERHFDGAVDEWYRGDLDTRAETPKGKKR